MTNNKKHISFAADKKVWKFLKFKSIEKEVSMKKLIMAALKDKYDLDLDNEIEDKTTVEDKDLTGLINRLEGTADGSAEFIQKVTAANIEYLKEKKRAERSDFVSDVYPKFSDHTEGSYWKASKSGFKQLSKLSDKLETPHGRGHSSYKLMV